MKSTTMKNIAPLTEMFLNNSFYQKNKILSDENLLYESSRRPLNQKYIVLEKSFSILFRDDLFLGKVIFSAVRTICMHINPLIDRGIMYMKGLQDNSPRDNSPTDNSNKKMKK